MFFTVAPPVASLELGYLFARAFLEDVVQVSCLLRIAHCFQHTLVVFHLFEGHLLPSRCSVLCGLNFLLVLFFSVLHPLLAQPHPVLHLLSLNLLECLVTCDCGGDLMFVQRSLPLLFILSSLPGCLHLLVQAFHLCVFELF